MKHIYRLFIALLILASLLTACAPAAEPEDENKPVTLEPIAGTDLNRLTLTEKAAERLGLETAPVVAQEGQVVIPYAARQEITVDFIQGDQAILSEGPETGTNVVTLGATELFGSEEEFEEE